MPARFFISSSAGRAFGRLLRQVVLDHLVVAARAANGLAQLEILLHRHLFVAGHEDVVRALRKSFLSASRSFSFSDFFFMVFLA